MPFRVIVRHCDHFPYEFIYVNSIQSRRALLLQQEDTVDNIGYTPSVFDHFQPNLPSYVTSICFPP
jgi:hypothetical protein